MGSDARRRSAVGPVHPQGQTGLARSDARLKPLPDVTGRAVNLMQCDG